MISGALIFAAGVSLDSGWLIAAGVVQFIWGGLKTLFVIGQAIDK